MDSRQVIDRLGSLVLRYRLDQRAVEEAPGVQQWWVEAALWESEGPAHDPEDEIIATMHLVKGSLLHTDLWEQLDQLEGDLSAVGEAVLDVAEGDLREDLIEQMQGFGNRLLILNSVRVADHWRGLGVGALVAGLALEVLRDDAACIVTFPAPLDDSRGAVREAAIEKLGRVWAQLGFAPYRDGTWVLDPASSALGDGIAALRARFHLQT